MNEQRAIMMEEGGLAAGDVQQQLAKGEAATNEGEIAARTDQEETSISPTRVCKHDAQLSEISLRYEKV
jgi:hypothetical protein